MEIIDEDGEQRLHVPEVKAGGLASAKGRYESENLADIQRQKTEKIKRLYLLRLVKLYSQRLNT